MKSSLSYVYVKYIPAYSIYTRPKPTQPRFRPLLSPLVPLQSASHLKFGRPSVTAACVNIAEAMHIECQGGDRKKITFKNQNLPTNPANFPCQIRHKPVFPVTLTKSYSSTLKSTTAVWPGRNQQDMIPAHLIGQSYPICTSFLTATGRLLYHELSP